MSPCCVRPAADESGIIVVMRDDTANETVFLPSPAGAASLRARRRERGGDHVAIAVYDGLAIFEFGVASDVFGLDRSEEYGVPWYRLSVCAARAGPVSADSGLQILAPRGLRPLRDCDTLIIPPTDRPDLVPAEVLLALRRAHRRGARLVSLCTGAFVLAAAGLLDGRRAATHWADSSELARQYPGVSVDPDVLYIDDGDILTSAGSAASIDLCLHLVRCDYGAEIASRLAARIGRAALSRWRSSAVHRYPATGRGHHQPAGRRHGLDAGASG